MFVALDRLSPMEPVQQDPLPELPPSTDPQREHQMMTRSQSRSQQSDLDRHDYRRYQPRFRINDRVIVRNNQGVGIHGAVRWIDEVVYAGDRIVAVGIETVRYCPPSGMTCL